MAKKRKNGFSIVEAVIALSVIVVVSITALSIVMSSIAARVNSANRSYAQGFANSALECFQASENEDEFLENLYFAEGVYPTSSGEKYIYVSEEHKFKSEITVDHSSERPHIEVYVCDRDGEEIVSFSYSKGG